MSSEGGSKLVDCPYCISAYPRREKLNIHIKNTHPGKPLLLIENSPIKILPKPAGYDDSNSNSSLLSDSFNKQKQKYKEKSCKCPHCGKGYVSMPRLRAHIESRHTKTNDPFAEVELNTDIVVKNNRTKLGYELYKVYVMLV